MSSFALRLPDDLKNKAAEQAAAAGVSLNQYIAATVASRVGAQAEAERYFKARGARGNVERAMEIVKKAGTELPQEGDELPEPVSMYGRPSESKEK